MNQPHRLPEPDLASVSDLIRHYVHEHSASWSLGTIGLIAEFHRDAGEDVTVDESDVAISVSTARGGMRINLHSPVTAVAYETLGKEPDGWSHAVALCLPTALATLHRRTVLTELGPDMEAVRAQDRAGILFDLGLNALQVNACVRSADPEVIARLRQGLGQPLLDGENGLLAQMPQLNPQRVFISAFGRVEVYQPIPGPDGMSPEGPHTHVLPDLMRGGRTHMATVPIPEGLVPCMQLHPAHPAHDSLGQRQPFNTAALTAFQQLLRNFGAPHLVAVKDSVAARIASGEPLAVLESRSARTAARIAQRQWRLMNPPDSLNS